MGRHPNCINYYNKPNGTRSSKYALPDPNTVSKSINALRIIIKKS